MTTKVAKVAIKNSARRYQSPDIPMSAIRRSARQIVEKFRPEKVILFGSYAKAEPRRDSDVDLLVVMPAWNEMSKAARIRGELKAPFSLDLIVRTPKHLQRGLDENDWFLRDVMETGMVLYATSNGEMGQKRRSRLARRATARHRARKAE